MSAEVFAQLTELSEKIATELVFAEAGTDLGLLPVNSLLGQMEELVLQTASGEVLASAAHQARRWVDEVLDTTGTFSALHLQRLGEWVPWWQGTVRACQTQTPLPPRPAERAAQAAEAASTPAAPSLAAEPAATGTEAEPVLVLNLEQDSELLGEFINEAQEHLQNIEQGVLVLEENPSDADTLNSIFRAFHTFKGCSGFLNLTAIQTLAHELESLLELARQHKLPITPALIDLILVGGDTLKQFTIEIQARMSGEKPPTPIVVPTLRLLASIRSVLAGKASDGEKCSATAEASGALDSQRASSAVSPASTPEPPQALRETAPGDARGAGQMEPAVAEPSKLPFSAAGETSAAAGRANAAATAVKVDTVKLDSLVDLVGELVIAESLVIQNEELNALRSQQLNRDLSQLGRITKDLQRIAMSLRMVPIRATFQKMHRLVRDLAGKLGKEVELVTEGEDTELDRTIVEQISDPLIHMVRNAVDHGIEMPEERRKLGKPATGTLSLRAFHQGGNIVIEIKDDGKGLKRERILAKALETGVVQPGDQLSDDEVFNLIFAPGFSTAEKVTDLSGRGVGMDVVRRNIEKLRGKIEIQSVPGQGSTFGIYLPLTLAIIDGLLVGVGGQRYILPTLLVRESFRPAAEAIHTVQGRGEMVLVRGKLRPLLRLYEHLGVEPASTDPAQSIVVVVEAGGDARCILVDKLLGKQEVVIKSLGETFRGNRSIAGAAILGDGRVGLILDPQALVQLEPAGGAC